MIGSALLALLVALPNQALGSLRVSAGVELRLPAEQATAAYSLDSDCASAELSGGVIVVKGLRACTTHIVRISGDVISETEVVVSARRGDLAARARSHSAETQEVGSVTTSYASDPAQLETAINVSRLEGQRSTSIALDVGHGHAFSATEANTTIPFASFRFSSPTTTFTLLDQRVEETPLTIDDTVIRGLHIQHNGWFLHAGVSSMTDFRQAMFESDPDRIVSGGYRFQLSQRNALISSVDWISASNRYLSGRSGTMGSLAWEFRQTDRLRLLAEVGIGRAVGTSIQLDYEGDADLLRLDFRAAPSDLPRLSKSQAPGIQADGYWTRRFKQTYSLDVNGSQNKYTLLDGTSESNSSWSGILGKQLSRRVSISGGVAGSRFGRPTGVPILSTYIPASISYESARFGNSFEYRYGWNQSTTLGSQSFRDSIRVGVGPFTLMGFASTQTQAPTVDFVLSNVPWLRQALLDAGIMATTPQQIEDFLRNNADLIAAGILRDISINLSPRRTQLGGTLLWSSPRRMFSARLESRWDRDDRIQGAIKSNSQDARLMVRLNRKSDVTLQGSLFETNGSMIGAVRVPVFSVSIHRQLTNVPDFIGPYAHGVVEGKVFADEDGLGISVNTGIGIAGVKVVLDGTRKTMTNDSGSYTFHRVTSGRHTVEILYEDTANHFFTTPPNVTVGPDSTMNFGIGRRKATIFGIVLNDAGNPLGGVVLHIKGPSDEKVLSNSNGDFSATDLTSGTYTVDIEPDSIPPSYALEGIRTKTTITDPNQPGEVHFYLRALRIVKGKLLCHARTLDPATGIEMQLDDRDVSHLADKSGAFVLRDLSAGIHELTVRRASKTTRHKFELSSAPSALSGLEVEVCDSSEADH